MPNIKIDLWCGRCGSSLNSSVSIVDNQITVTCDRCISTAKQEGYDIGFYKGYDKGKGDTK